MYEGSLLHTRKIVLHELYTNNGSFVSGEHLAKLCGVSRAAIWKAVQTLRQEGYIISGTPNGGYMLTNTVDLVDTNLVMCYMAAHFPLYAHNLIECFKEIDSTNNYAKRILADCGNLRDANGELTAAGKKYHGAIIIAESQTKGRGLLGRTFYSPAKTGIYLTIIYAPRGGIIKPARLTAYTAVAICNAIQKLYAIQPAIKWVNDIFINGKKAGGILTEGVTSFSTGLIESAIIGIGINIEHNPEVFPSDVAQIAGSILSESHAQTVKRYELAAEIAGQVLSVYEKPAEEVMAAYKTLSFIIGKMVQVHPIISDTASDYAAKAIDIDNEAALIVELEDGSQKRLFSGEVSLHSAQFTKT